MKTMSKQSRLRCAFKSAAKAILVLTAAIVSGNASAAWWKGAGWTKSGSLNNDYWEGVGIGYDDWYSAGGHDSITAEVWADAEAVFEREGFRYYVSLDSDFQCRNMASLFGAHSTCRRT